MMSTSVNVWERVAYHAPAANTQATITTSAPGAKNYTVIRALAFVLTGDTAGASSVVAVTVRDGAGGTILWSANMIAPQNGTSVIALSDLNIRVPTAGNAAQAQFEAAGGGTTTRESVMVSYYTTDTMETARGPIL